ncbi:MAG: alpha/beta hydrolase [Cyanobacteria bacterium RM1_2_2]|nr:alpha/beta hydrolase [Cyanobacteria bacterium RM1_2_2]
MTFSYFRQKLARPKTNMLRFGLLLLSVTVGTFSFAPASKAAEKLVVTYGPFSATLQVEDLETLVHTDQVPGALRFYLNLASLDPNLLRSVLSMQLGASINFMQGMLESESGEQLLAQMSEVIHLPPDRPDIQMLKSSNRTYSSPTETNNITALREALIRSADDRQVIVLEVLQNYPTERVYLNAGKLIQLMNSMEPEAAD